MANKNEYHSDYFDEVKQGERRGKKIEQGLFYLLLLLAVIIFAVILLE